MVRHRRSLTDAQIHESTQLMTLLRAVADGRVTQDGTGGIFATWRLDGKALGRMQLVWLRDLDLIALSIGGPLTIEPRGARILRDHGAAADHPEGTRS